MVGPASTDITSSQPAKRFSASVTYSVFVRRRGKDVCDDLNVICGRFQVRP